MSSTEESNLGDGETSFFLSFFLFFFFFFLSKKFVLLLCSIIEQLKVIAQAHKCYKVILDCNEKNQGFYEKLGFKKKEIQMAVYFE